MRRKFNPVAFTKGADFPRKWFNIVNKKDEDMAEVYIYDQIGQDFWGDGLSAKAFIDEFNSIESSKVTLRVNSPGGDVWDGKAIFNALVSSGKEITAYVDGIAASAASFIIMAADKIIMPKNAEIMIHDAWAFAAGNADDMREIADHLEQTTNQIADIYVDARNIDSKEVRKLMKAETFMTAEQAVELGFADEVISNKKVKNNIFDKLYFSNTKIDNPEKAITAISKRSFENLWRDAEEVNVRDEQQVPEDKPKNKRSFWADTLNSLDDKFKQV